MSFAYRPTPILNPGPQTANLSGAVSGGVMGDYDPSVNWKAYFDSQRAAVQGKPWIVRSGAMGAFVLGQDDGTLPLPPPPADPGISLDPLAPPDISWAMPSPIAPSIVPYDPGAPPAFVTGGSPLTPPSMPGFNWQSLIAPVTSLVTNITRAATGSGGINPSVPPGPPPQASQLTQPSSLVAQAQALQAQANALQASNPQLAAQYRASAASLLAQAGGAPGGSWFTQSNVIPGLPNWGVLAGVLAIVVLGSSMLGGRRGK